MFCKSNVKAMKIIYTIKVIDNERDRNIIRTYDSEMEVIKRINTINTNFMEASESMKFIYAMMKKEPGSYKYKPEQIEKAQDYMSDLSEFDPHNIYTIDKANDLIKKEPRTLQPLTGELADLEHSFLKDSKLAQGSRQAVIKLLDNIKRGYIEPSEPVTAQLKSMIFGNDLFTAI